MPDPLKHESPDLRQAQTAMKQQLAQALKGVSFDRAGNVAGQTQPAPPPQPQPAPQPAPEPQPQQTAPAEPSADPATPPPAEPPSAPESPSPEPAAPASVPEELSFLSPENFQFLVARGLKPEDRSTWGVVDQWMKKSIEDGNKLAEMLRQDSPESVSPPPESPPPPEQVQLDPRAIEVHLKEAMGQDSDAQTWLSKYKSNSSELNRLGYADGEIVPGGELDKLQQNIRTLETVIREPHTQNDSVALEDYTNRLNQARTDLQFRLGEARDRESRNERLDRLWRERQQEYLNSIEQQLSTEATEKARRDYWQNRAKREAQWMADNWTKLATRVAQGQGVDPTELDRHSRILSAAWDAGHVQWAEDKVITPETVEEFIAFAAEDLKRARDSHHRQQAAEYGHLRQQQPAAVPGSPPPATPHADKPVSFKRQIRSVGNLLRQNVMAPRG